MKNLFFLVFAFTLISGTCLAQTSEHSSEEVEKAIQKNFDQMIEAMGASDADALSMHFTEDALLKFPGQEPLHGREAIAKAHEQLIKDGMKIMPTTTEVETFGDLAYEIGTYQFLSPDNDIVDEGHYASIWKNENGDWLLYRDLISSTEPKAASEETAEAASGEEHLYVELWTPKQAWLDLDQEERQGFFDHVGGELEKLGKEGVEILGFGLNDQETPHRSDHNYFAVWKMPSKDHVEMLEESVEGSGWYDYFEQVNARGKWMAPPVALEHMVNHE